jgi:hypothetical protein
MDRLGRRFGFIDSRLAALNPGIKLSAHRRSRASRGHADGPAFLPASPSAGQQTPLQFRRQCPNDCNFAYSDLASRRLGRSGSADFQSSRNSL